MEFKVTEKAMRSSSPERQCFYCKEPVGQPHKENCPTIMKNVRIRMSVEYEIAVASLWDKEMIECARNEPGWCQSNAIAELEDLAKEKGCHCGMFTFEYLNDTSDPYLLED
jgi:hypothetical protein